MVVLEVMERAILRAGSPGVCYIRPWGVRQDTKMKVWMYSGCLNAGVQAWVTDE